VISFIREIDGDMAGCVYLCGACRRLSSTWWAVDA
jgi:hypothetical protein